MPNPTTSSGNGDFGIEPVWCTVDTDACFNNFSSGWYSLCRRFELVDLEPERLTGQGVDRVLAPEWVQALRASLHSPMLTEPEELPESGLSEVFSLWPLFDQRPRGLRLTLRRPALMRVLWQLENPVFCGIGEEDKLRGFNGVGRRLLVEHPELEQRAELERWVGQQAQGRRLTALGGLSLEGRRLWIPSLSSLQGSGSFRMLSKLMRILLHDVSNPLAAVRMMAEVASRGSRHYADPGRLTADMVQHLDVAISAMRTLRGLAQAVGRSQSLDAVALFSEAVTILGSELDRRELTVDLSRIAAPEPEIVGSRDAFLWLALGALLMTLGRSSEGDVLVIEGTVVEEHWRLQGRLRMGSGPRPWLAEPDLDFDTVMRWLAPFGGNLRAWSATGDPLWVVDLPL